MNRAKMSRLFLAGFLTLMTAPACVENTSGGDGDGDSDGDSDTDGDSVSNGSRDSDSDGDSTRDRPAPPAPATDDPGFVVVEEGVWSMVGDGLTRPDTTYRIHVTAAPEIEAVEIWLGGNGPTRFEGEGGNISTELDVTDLPAGDYEVVLAIAGSDEAFATRTLHRTHAYYFIMACDWDDPDNDQSHLDNMDLLRERYPGLVYTQYFGPYTFTDPEVSVQRRQELAQWLLDRSETHGDELALHIHPYCSFVEYANLSCRKNPSFIYDDGDESGYSVILSSYTMEEQTTLLEAAVELFEANGLGRPTSFRAGGWTGDESTLEALAAAGFTMQADAVVADRIEEWDGLANGVLYNWLIEHWGAITVTSQPYYASLDDIEVPALSDEAVPVLQVPANGVIADYITAEELVEIFYENWDGETALKQPTVIHSGLHPTNFRRFSYFEVLDDGLANSADLAMYDNDEGPVIFASAGDMVHVFPIE